MRLYDKLPIFFVAHEITIIMWVGLYSPNIISALECEASVSCIQYTVLVHYVNRQHVILTRWAELVRCLNHESHDLRIKAPNKGNTYLSGMSSVVLPGVPSVTLVRTRIHSFITFNGVLKVSLENDDCCNTVYTGICSWFIR